MHNSAVAACGCCAVRCQPPPHHLHVTPFLPPAARCAAPARHPWPMLLRGGGMLHQAPHRRLISCLWIPRWMGPPPPSRSGTAAGGRRQPTWALPSTRWQTLSWLLTAQQAQRRSRSSTPPRRWIIGLMCAAARWVSGAGMLNQGNKLGGCPCYIVQPFLPLPSFS